MSTAASNGAIIERGFVVGPGEGVPGAVGEVKAAGRSTANSLTVIKLGIETGPPRHIHTREDESLYVFSGVLDIECGADHFRVEPGWFAFLPRNIPHTFHSVDGAASALLIVTPGGLDEYFVEMSAAMGDAARMGDVRDAYGIVPA